MLIIQHLSEMIKEEISDAEKYAQHAVSYYGKDPELAETFFTLSNEELRHVDLLHEQVIRIIEEYKSAGNTPPEGMLMIYNYLHDEMIRDADEIRKMLLLYQS